MALAMTTDRRSARCDIARSLLGGFYAIAVACAAALVSAQPQRGPAPAFDLEEATVAQLQARMQTGQETSRSIVDKYLARIQAIDRGGPELRSVLEINPD